MTCNRCSENFSLSSRHGLPSSGSSGGSSYPSNLIYTTTNCSTCTCQLGSSLNTGCQETCVEPISCQSSCVVSRPCQTACSYFRSSTPCNPCQEAYPGSPGFEPSSFHSLDCRSSGYYIVGCGPDDFEHLYYVVSAFPSQSYGFKFCHPTHLPASTYQPCYKAICRNILHGF